MAEMAITAYIQLDLQWLNTKQTFILKPTILNLEVLNATANKWFYEQQFKQELAKKKKRSTAKEYSLLGGEKKAYKS